MGDRDKRTSNMTTEFPRITTVPMRTFSPPSFSSTASSRTMFRKTWTVSHRQHPCAIDQRGERSYIVSSEHANDLAGAI